MQTSCTETYSIEEIALDELLERVQNLHRDKFRLVQIGATRIAEELELTYSFDQDRRLHHLRFRLPAATARVPSISSIFWCAFLYENELHDLFGLEVNGMVIDFHGSLYQTTIKFPFGKTRPPIAAAGAAPSSAPPPANAP